MTTLPPGMVPRGLTKAQVAAFLGIALDTVKRQLYIADPSLAAGEIPAFG